MKAKLVRKISCNVCNARKQLALNYMHTSWLRCVHCVKILSHQIKHSIAWCIAAPCMPHLLQAGNLPLMQRIALWYRETPYGTTYHSDASRSAMHHSDTPWGAIHRRDTLDPALKNNKPICNNIREKWTDRQTSGQTSDQKSPCLCH